MPQALARDRRALSTGGAAGAMELLTNATPGAMTGVAGSYTAIRDNLGRLTSGQYTYPPTGLAAQLLYQIQLACEDLSRPRLLRRPHAE